MMLVVPALSPDDCDLWRSSCISVRNDVRWRTRCRWREMEYRICGFEYQISRTKVPSYALKLPGGADP